MTEIKASFDTQSLEGQMRVFNAQNGASVSLKTLESGTVIEVSGVLQYGEKTDTYGQDQDVIVTTLFGVDGSSYAGVSDTVASAGEKLIEFMKVANLEIVKVKIVQQTSSKGNMFLNLQLVG